RCATAHDGQAQPQTHNRHGDYQPDLAHVETPWFVPGRNDLPPALLTPAFDGPCPGAGPSRGTDAEAYLLLDAGRDGRLQDRRKGKRRCAVDPERSRGTAAGMENGLDKLLWRVAGGRRGLGGGKRGLRQLNGLSVAVQVSDAPGTLGQVLLELGPFLGGQVA